MARLAVIALAILIVGGSFGCSQRSSAPGPSVPTNSPPSTSPTQQAGEPFCVVDLPASWNELFGQGRIPLPDGNRFVPTAAAPDGSAAFGALYSADWSGVAEVSQRGAITQISKFADPAKDQISGAAFDGRWLVWSETHSLSDWNDWDIKVWDRTAGDVFTIAAAPRVNGQTVRGPPIFPAISDGNVAWVQANQSARGEVHLFSLADRHDRILGSESATQPVAFWGPNVVWAETDPPGGSAHLVMADVSTGDPVQVPEPLASVRHWGSSLTATADLVAWDDAVSLWLWHQGDSDVQRVYKAEIGDYLEFVAIAGDLVTWGGVKNQWAADLRTGAITKITQFGWRWTNGNILLMMQPIGPQKESPGPRSETFLVDASKLPPLPACES